MIDFDELKIGEKYELTIDDLDMFGLGIAHFKGNTIFIDNSLIGEVVEVEIIDKRKNIYFAKNKRILVESCFRVKPLCPYFNVCGGCDLQHLSYKESLNFKKKQLINSLYKIAGIIVDEKNLEVIESDNEYYYRNKISLQVDNFNGIAKLCMYKKQSNNSIIVNDCVIADKGFKIVIELVNKFFEQNKIKAYNKNTKFGDVKNVVARIIDNNLMLTFVATKFKRFNFNSLYEELKKHFLKVGINININKNNKEILSNKFIHIIGDESLKFDIMNVQQNITNASFLQVNFNVQNKLYNYVLSKVDNNVINAYSGAGLLTCLIAKNYNKLNGSEVNNKQIIGIELNKDATRLADIAKKENEIECITNICGDALEEIKKINLENYTLIVDPPRSGMDDKLVKSLEINRPNKIIYISCSAQTLAKNLKDLIEFYNIQEIKAFDMFPQTKNVETVVILNKK